MSLSPQDAATTLHEAETAIRRSARAYGYRCASPHLILWGAIWVLGYCGSWLSPSLSGWFWAGLCVGGGLLSGYFGYRTKTQVTAGMGWRIAALVAATAVFIVTVYALFGPVTGPQAAAFPALLVGIVYFGIGLWGQTRMAITGAAVYASTLGGYYLLAPYFLLWMAFVGGGALIASGLWLRRL